MGKLTIEPIENHPFIAPATSAEQERENTVPGKLEGKVAIVSGASAGIGQASARALAREGADLVLTARRRERLDALLQEVRALGRGGIAVMGDAREEATALKTVEAAKSTFGRIDILINNVGVGSRTRSVQGLVHP